jgi:hypothetical protein
MTGILATAEQTALLALYLNGGSKTNTATVYMGLCTGVTQNGGTITGEPTIGTNGYARVSIAANGTTVFGAASAGAISNTAAITFPTSTGAWSAGATLSYWFLSTASTAGTAFMYGLIDNGAAADGVAVTATNQIVSFIAGALVLTASSW